MSYLRVINDLKDSPERRKYVRRSPPRSCEIPSKNPGLPNSPIADVVHDVPFLRLQRYPHLLVKWSGVEHLLSRQTTRVDLRSDEVSREANKQYAAGLEVYSHLEEIETPTRDGSRVQVVVTVRGRKAFASRLTDARVQAYFEAKVVDFVSY